MKQKWYFATALGILLLAAAASVEAEGMLDVSSRAEAGAEENTAPPPPPDREATAIPPPNREATRLPDPARQPGGRQTPGRGLFPARGQTPAQAQTPARSQTPTRGQTPAGTPAQAQTPAGTPAAQQTASATRSGTSSTGLPSRGLFLGGMIGYGGLSPEGDEDSISGGGSVSGGLLAGYDFGLFTGQVEFLLAGDSVEGLRTGSGYHYNQVSGGWDPNWSYSSYSGTLIQIPLVVKLDLHLWRFVLQPQAGIYLNFGLGDAKRDKDYSAGWENPLLGGLVGGTLGIQIGKGFLFGDLRLTTNFANTTPENTKGYTRKSNLFSLGYQRYF